MSVGNTLRILIYDPIQEGEGAESCLAGLLQVSADHAWQNLLLIVLPDNISSAH